MRKFNLLLLLPAILPGSVHAEEPIVVTATRSPRPLSSLGQSVSLIDAATIESRQAVNIADLLRDLPGVALARNGGPGAITTVFVRGANADQTTVLIDGVKLNDPSSTAGGFFFGDLLVGNIARVEVLRGPQSVLWGSQSIGGVVNLITRTPGEDLRVNARAEYGWRNSAQLVGNVSATQGPVAASLGGGWFRTGGISAARAGSERDGYRNLGANAKIEIALGNILSVDLRGWYADGRTEVDGFPAPLYLFADTGQYSKNRQWVGYAGLNARLFEGRLKNRLALAYTDVRRRAFDPDAAPIERGDYVGRNERIEYQGIFDLGPGWQASFGAERETQRFRKVEAFDPAPRRGSARTDSLYALLAATPVAGLSLTAGTRVDDHSGFGRRASLSASAAWSPNGGATTLRASYAEGFKAPSLYQLASEYGNPALDPESATGWDAGLSQKLFGGMVELGAVWFSRTTRNLIDFAYCPGNALCDDGRYGYYTNINRAFAQGIEAVLRVAPADGLSIEAAYAYVQSEDRSPDSAEFGKQLVRRPKNSLSVTADYLLPSGLQAGASLRWVGPRRDVDYDAWPARDVQLASHALADLRAAYPIASGIALYGRVENLFDTRYETVLRYGAPGRAAYLGLRLNH